MSTPTRRSPRRHAPGRRPSSDPASLRPVKVRPIFDSRPHRNRGQHGIAHELRDWPDDLLIANMVEHGCPRWAAEQIRFHPPARFAAATFYLAVLEAREGDKLAKEKVDYMRWAWQEMRKQEVIADWPEHTVGLFER